jgi:hypothetical protein
VAPNFQRLGDAGQRVLRAARKTAKAPHFGLDISATLHWQEEAIWHEETKLHPYNQTMTVEVRPATPERWNDLVTVFGRRADSSTVRPANSQRQSRNQTIAARFDRRSPMPP